MIQLLCVSGIYLRISVTALETLGCIIQHSFPARQAIICMRSYNKVGSNRHLLVLEVVESLKQPKDCSLNCRLVHKVTVIHRT